MNKEQKLKITNELLELFTLPDMREYLIKRFSLTYYNQTIDDCHRRPWIIKEEPL